MICQNSLTAQFDILPEAQKEVINLAFFKGMSQREIASKRQISLGTVKTRLHLAQRKLQNYLVPMQNKI
jgi:RNA polymerase sigma-70 factor (ECF subfamily)